MSRILIRCASIAISEEENNNTKGLWVTTLGQSALFHLSFEKTVSNIRKNIVVPIAG